MNKIVDVAQGIEIYNSTMIFDASDFALELNIHVKTEPIVDSVGFRIVGNVERALPLVALILEELCIRAIDLQTSEFFDPKSAHKSARAFMTWRDDVFKKLGNKKSWLMSSRSIREMQMSQ